MKAGSFVRFLSGIKHKTVCAANLSVCCRTPGFNVDLHRPYTSTPLLWHSPHVADLQGPKTDHRWRASAKGASSRLWMQYAVSGPTRAKASSEDSTPRHERTHTHLRKDE